MRDEFAGVQVQDIVRQIDVDQTGHVSPPPTGSEDPVNGLWALGWSAT